MKKNAERPVEINNHFMASSDFDLSDMSTLKDKGYKTIVDMRRPSGDEFRQEVRYEHQKAKELGLEYIMMPLEEELIFNEHEEKKVDFFMEEILKRDKPVFVHSHHNEMSKAFAIIYVGMKYHLSGQDALEQASKYRIDFSAKTRDFILRYLDKKARQNR